MEKYFNRFLVNIKLTQKQRDDAKTKFNGVCDKLHSHYYPDKKYDGSTKLLIGSYGKKTNIRPARDIDVIFKIPSKYYDQYDKHESNGQSNLLSKIKSILEEKYSSSTIKVFGKVVVVEFSDTSHNVEVLPSFEQEDRKFKIPNTSNGGFWEIWDPRSEIDKINNSDKDNDGRTRSLIRMIKKWSEKCSVDLKSYKIEEAVMDFFDEEYEFISTSKMVYDFFVFLSDEVEEKNKSYVDTAIKRSKKAIAFEEAGKELKSIQEWKKIFGNDFPGQSSVKEASSLEKYYSEKEEYIEEICEIELNDEFYVNLNCRVSQDGWRPTLLKKMHFLQKRKKLEFFIENTNVPEPFEVKWKVRNYGEEAKSRGDLRGQIWSDTGSRKRIENTKYYGDHFVECYLIKNSKCVALGHIKVLIRN